MNVADGYTRALSVLVIDNHDDGAESLAQLLRLYGCEVAVAATATAALAPSTAPPEVVFLELALPDMDGCELARHWRERDAGKGPLFVALTTRGTEDDRRRAVKAGIDLHFLKPAEPKALLSVLAHFARDRDA